MFRRIILATIAVAAVAAPVVTVQSADAAIVTRSCAPVAAWNRIHYGMSPTRVQSILRVRALVDQPTSFYGGGYALKSLKYRVCGWDHGYVDYYKDPGTGFYANDKQVYHYI